MDHNISFQERATKARGFCENYLSYTLSEYDDFSTEARARFVNALAFALDDDQPILTIENVIDRGHKSVEFAVFTKNRVLYFNGECERDKQPSIRVIPRRTLESLSILDSPAVIDVERFNGHARYALTYANGISFELNARNARKDSYEAISNLLTALYEDLEA